MVAVDCPHHTWPRLLEHLHTYTYIAVKGKVYRTMIRPVLIYGSEAWTLKDVKRNVLKELK